MLKKLLSFNDNREISSNNGKGESLEGCGSVERESYRVAEGRKIEVGNCLKRGALRV